MNSPTFSIQYYLRAIGANSVATGIHSVLFPWLVIGVVGASASELGLAQMAILLPNTIFLLFGGVISDRIHRGAWLSLLYMLYVMPLSMLWWFYAFNTLTFQLLIVSGVMFGFLNAFVQPARESLLVFTPSHLMHQSVAKSIVVKFIAQGVGFGLAGLLGYIELSVLLGIQIFMFGLSSLLISRAHRVNKNLSRQTIVSKPSWRVLLNALTLFVNNKSFLHLLFLVFATGLLPFGVYLVGIPVLVRQVYDGGAMLLSALQLLFTCGVISANVAVARRATNFVNPGKLMVITFLWRGTLFIFAALSPPLWILFSVVFLWGLSTGLSMAVGRTILHNNISGSYRARALSIYQISLVGGTPLGAWLCGVLINNLGISTAFTLISIPSIIIAITMSLFSPLWKLRTTNP